MAVCSHCGQVSSRVRSRWTEKNVRLPDQCRHCAPESFEKFTVPSDKKIWMGYEAHPNEYEKRYDGDGHFYVRKPEYRDEQEQKLALPATDEDEARNRAEAKKRAERRTLPMDGSEMLHALAKARQIAEQMENAPLPN